jgi:hypothetical protein
MDGDRSIDQELEETSPLMVRQGAPAIRKTEAEMKILLSSVAMAALLTCGLATLTPADAMTAQTHNEPGYNFLHPMADADNVPVRAEVKHDGISSPAALGGACTSEAMPVIGAG